MEKKDFIEFVSYLFVVFAYMCAICREPKPKPVLCAIELVFILGAGLMRIATELV